MPSRRTKTPTEPPVPAESDPDDSSIASDDAFDSEDERRYGGFFEERRSAKSDKDHDGTASESDDDGSESHEDGTDSEDDEEEADDEDNYMLSLLDKLDDKERPSRNRPESGIATHTKESEFAAAVVKGKELTLDLLMGSIQDTAGFGQAQKQLKKVAQGEATPVPMARVASDRLKRKLLFEEQCKDVSQWIDAVQQNRQAETLDFRPKQRLEVTPQGLVDSFTPTTEFEKQIHAELQKAGLEDEEAILRRERDRLQDDLGANEITLEEYKKRRGELAKMRALMFYHEQKRHHINKIKSKKYRRIRKRQRERNEEAVLTEDPDQLQEKEETERILERASLAHKNTSKWAKRVLKRGNKVDTNTRKALSESLRRGDDLLKRMKNTRRGEESDSEDEDLVASAKAVLAKTEDGADTVGGKHKGLFQLSFMQKGIEKQKARAREEARQLLRELEVDEEDRSVNEDDQVDAPVMAPKIETASKEEMKTVLAENEFVVASLKLGQKNRVMVSGNIDLDLLGNSMAPARQMMDNTSGTHSEHCVTVDHIMATQSKTSKKGAQSHWPSAKHRHTPMETTGDESNPWVPAPESTQTGKRLIQDDSTARAIVDIVRAGSLLDDATPKQPHPSMDGAAPLEHTGEISSLTQDELVRRAFASVARSDEEEFAAEKHRVVEDEDIKSKQLLKESKMVGAKGWGSWAGMGAPPPKPVRKLPEKLQPPASKLGKRVRVDDKKPNVILSEKRIKRLANNYMLSVVPYPFTSREEYEKAMSGSLGKEFNVTSAFENMTRPAVLTRPGKVIQPLSQKLKVRRAAAKF